MCVHGLNPPFQQPWQRSLLWLPKSININHIFHKTERFTLMDPRTFLKVIKTLQSLQVVPIW